MTFRGVVSDYNPLIIPIFITHSGCPHKCSFCNQLAITESEPCAPENLEAEVEKYLSWSKKRDIIELSFYGGSFTAMPHARMLEYIEAGAWLIKKGLVHKLRCSTRPDAIDDERAELLKKSGFETVELGVQSFSEDLLNKMNRGHTGRDALNAYKILKNFDIKVIFQFITGYPYETEADVNITCNVLNLCQPDGIRIYPFVPLPDTEIMQRLNLKNAAMLPVKTIIERSARLFLAAQRLGIPVIRIGLPSTAESKGLYPDNLAQVVIANALKMLADSGETDIIIPESWQTSANMVKSIEKS